MIQFFLFKFLTMRNNGMIQKYDYFDILIKNLK